MTDPNSKYAHLKKLREEICEKTEQKNRFLELRDWLVQSLKDLLEQSKSNKVKKDDVINKLADLLCVIEPEDDNDE
jgi:uncharacterized coiled-coil DUF342 family protein